MLVTKGMENQHNTKSTAIPDQAKTLGLEASIKNFLSTSNIALFKDFFPK